MHVIGTAGHVDHGKSTLVEALTGTHPDRLLEEKKREMTIDLGFAWMTLLNGDEVGIVDVPGHRDFIENMLAGVGGIDAVIFVIAADEGVMPQTREHLAILDLLQVENGVIALTKIDLVEGPEWVDMVSLDIRQFLSGTRLANGPIIPVSARKQIGIEALKTALQGILEQIPPRRETGKPRLPIDRVFKISGFGTVVTGTLIDGQLSVGEEIEIFPGGLKGKIRGLQTHQQKEMSAFPGSRTAVNISGLEANLINRGDVLGLPGQFEPTRLLDVHLRLLNDAARPLSHHAEVKLFLGTAEILAYARLLSKETIVPGESGFVQLELKTAVIASKGDRFILRIPSPGETIGGGEVIEVNPGRRHKRFDEHVISQLEMGLNHQPDVEILRISNQVGIQSLGELIGKLNNPSVDWVNEAKTLITRGSLLLLGEEKGDAIKPEDWLLVTPGSLREISKKLEKFLSNYHQLYPMRSGMPLEEIKSKFKWPTRIFLMIVAKLASQGLIKDNKNTLSLPDFKVKFTVKQEKSIQTLLSSFDQAPFSPPGVKECQEALGREVYQALIEQKTLVQVSNDVVFRCQEYQMMLERVGAEKEMTVARFRDMFQTSRKYALAFLEHLDATGVAVREGDIHRIIHH
jgi:selenocysteine-specific elongation factor